MALTSQYQLDVISSLTKAGLAPGSTPLIPKDFKPSVAFEVKFAEESVSLGNVFKTSETKSAPTISFETERTDSSYTLLLVDPDAPTPEEPKFAYWRHWILTGLPNTSNEAVTAYLGPGPKDETATPHRYLFLLFQEPDGFAVKKSDVGGEEFVDRRSFKAAEWVEKHGLKLVGINWFSGVGDSYKK